MLLQSEIEKTGEKKVNKDEEIKQEDKGDLGENVTSIWYLVSFFSGFMRRPIMLYKVYNQKIQYYKFAHTLYSCCILVRNNWSF